MHYQIFDFLLTALAYGGMGLALIIGRGILVGLTEDLAAALRPKLPQQPNAKLTVARRIARTRR
jgi:hypothetical protein